MSFRRSDDGGFTHAIVRGTVAARQVRNCLVRWQGVVVEFLSGAAVLQGVAELAATRQGQFAAAVAYVGRNAPEILPLRAGDVIVVNGSDNAVASGATDPRAIAEYLASGVRVVNHPWLHAKVYVAGTTAIVGSANLSDRAHSGDVAEAAVRTTDRGGAAAVRRFVHGLISSGGQDIDSDWVEEAMRLFPDRPVAPAWNTAPAAPTAPFRLWLGWWAGDRRWTAAEERAYDEVVADAAAFLRPRARFQPVGRVEDPSAQGHFKSGDMVVMLGMRQAQLVEFQRFRTVRGRRPSGMALYRRDSRYPTLTNARVRRALEAVDSTLPADEYPDDGTWLEHTHERRAVLDLWGITDPGVP